MILAIDVGNTNITMGVYNNDSLEFTSRIATDRNRTTDQYAVEFIQIISLYGADIKTINDAIISSVVPELTPVLSDAVKKIAKKKPLIIGPGVKSGLNIKIENPAQLGADLVCTAVGAIEKYPLPCLVLDLGTATKISVIDGDGTYLGCTISPGVGISLRALSSGTSQLPTLSLKSPRSVIGTNSVKSMQAGIVLGTAAMLDGLCDRICEELKTDNITIVSTGGLSQEITKHCKHNTIYDENLVLDGLTAIYNKNRK